MPAAFAQDIAGDWQGILHAGPADLRLAFHFTRSAGGAWSGTLDSLDQGAKGLPLAEMAVKDSSVSFRVPVVRGSYTGTVDEQAASIHGTWTQAQPIPLDLRRITADAAAAAAPKRPQNPVKPYPYREEEVAYENLKAGVKLAATFTIPEGKGPFPAVVLITGSGPQDRDETLRDHKPFLVLADYLTRRGVAVLRADDRGFGKSTGNFDAATTADFATDAEAGIAWLQKRPEVDPHRIGLIGHSEGGAIAPMIAARNRAVAFIVMLAGPAVPGDQILPEQVRLIAMAQGVPAEAAGRAARVRTEILALVEREKDPAALEKQLREKLGKAMPEEDLAAFVKAMSTPWFRYFLTYDPAADLAKVTCPVLALNGDNDTQVSSKQNLPAIRQALEKAGNKNFETVELSGLNHLFQKAQTGSPFEYDKIEETISPAVLEKIASWISQR